MPVPLVLTIPLLHSNQVSCCCSHLAAIPQAIDGTLGRGMAQTSTFSSSTGVRPSVRLPSKKRHPEFNLSCSGGSRQELVYHISSSDNALAMRDWKLAPCIKLI
ncbi:uncharacterized [Tachysurus ichikawai]